MAQLPPKIPSFPQNWPPFPPPPTSMPNSLSSPPPPPPSSTSSSAASWLDDFLDFSTARRGLHRRSISDSIAFLETTTTTTTNNNINNPFSDQCRNSSSAALLHPPPPFDRLDDDQLMSMFSDDISIPQLPPNSPSNPSTPSDQNSNNDDKNTPTDEVMFSSPLPPPMKNEPADGEISSSSQVLQQSQPPPPPSSAVDNSIDPKRVKRYEIYLTHSIILNYNHDNQ